MKNIFYRDVWRNVIARRDNEATFECCIPIRVANLFPKSGGFSIYLCLALIANPPPIQIRQLKFLPSPSRLPLLPGSFHWTICSYRSTIVHHIQQWAYHHAIMVSAPLPSSSRRRRQIKINTFPYLWSIQCKKERNIFTLCDDLILYYPLDFAFTQFSDHFVPCEVWQRMQK